MDAVNIYNTHAFAEMGVESVSPPIKRLQNLNLIDNKDLLKFKV